jgi:DNA-binding winged helix-turn-helix (wHTH) protein/TolB-like protein/Tfp pilus assembly protein PilF
LLFVGQTSILKPTGKSFKNLLNYLLKAAFNIVTSAPTKLLYEFGEFRLDVDKHRLLRDGEIVALTPKAIEMLKVLVQHRGQLVERDQLMNAVWGDVVVEDGNLTVTISMLRKTLGENGSRKFIETVPRLGYKFVADVHEVSEEVPALIVEKQTSGRIVIDEEIRLDGRSVARHLLPASRRRVAGIGAIVTVLLLGTAVVAYFQPWKRNRANIGVANIKSIAVLPLKSFGEGSDDKPLRLGFADALITSLGKISEVRVVSINSVSRYADLQKEPREIGKDLGVDGVFDGTLQRANGKLRVTLRLIRTSDGQQMWNASFDESESEIFRLQDAMAAQTAEALALHLKPKDQKRQTQSQDAYQAYLRGRFFFDKRTSENYEKAIAEFERAISLDPNYAVAYTGLADVYALQANFSDGEARDALYEKSRNTTVRALQLDEGLAEAHTTLAWIKRTHDWDWAGSEHEFKRALELNPNYVNAHQWYALLLTTLGRTDEALTEIEKARELEPLSVIVLRNFFTIRQYRRETYLLPALAEQIASLDESKANTYRIAALARTGDYAKVIEIAEGLHSDLSQDLTLYQADNLTIAYTRLQQTAKAERLIRYLEGEANQRAEAAFHLAVVYAELGRSEAAIGLLSRCLDARDDRLVWIKVEPRLDSLRKETRFQEIVRRMNLPA